MASLALGIVGAIAGSAIPGIGWQIGWTAGSLLGGLLFPPRLGPQGSGRLDDLRVSGSAYGTAIPIVYGQMRVPGMFTWSPDLVEASSGGGKGGGKGKSQTGARYTSSFAVAFCQGPVAGIKSIWFDDLLVYENGVLVDGFGEVTIYLGDETQVADPLIEADKGVGSVSGHRGVCYVVFEEVPLEKFGNRRPNVSAEIASADLAYTEILQSSQETVVVRQADGSLWMGGTFGGALLAEVANPFDIACASKSSSPTALYVDDAGQLWANGYNNSGGHAGVSVFGNGITTNTNTSGAWVDTHGGNALPNVGAGNIDFCSVNSHVHLIKADGALWFWGHGGPFINVSYRGDGSRVSTGAPIQVHAGPCLQVVVNSDGVAILLADGTVWCTGQGLSGWMGNGTTSDMSSWTASTITDVIKIAGCGSSGAGALLCLKSDGTVWASGNNDDNFLGNLASGNVTSFVQVPIGAVITDIRATKSKGACAQDNAGNVWAWGEGAEAGQSASVGTKKDPAIVIANCRAIGASNADLFVINDLDDVYAWGLGTGNQRGDNSTADYTVPTLMPWDADRSSETVQTILDDVADRCGLAGGEYDFSACSGSQVTGYILPSRDEARSLIDALIRCHFVDIYETDGKIYGIIRGGSTTQTIAEDDMQAHETGGKMPAFCEHERGNENELPARIDLSYYTAIRDYDEVTASATRVTNPTALDQVTVKYPGTLSQTDGRHIAEALLYEQWMMRDHFKVWVGPKHIGIIPSDIPLIPIEPGAAETEMKVIKADYSVFGLQSLELSKHDPNVYVQVAEGATIEPSTTGIFELQESELYAWSAPFYDDDLEATNFGVYAAVTAPAGRWDGANVRVSTGGQFYQYTTRAIAGLTTTILAAPPVESTAVWDEGSTVTVNLTYGSVTSAARLDVLNGANRAYIGGVNDGEYIGFATVTSLGGQVYRLSNLLRGQRGTDMNWGGHAVGDQFVLLDSTVKRVVPTAGGNTNYYGVDVDVIIVGGIGLAPPPATVTVNVDGAEFMPYSVSQALGDRDGSNNLTVTWQRRTRIGGEMVDLMDVPLSEYNERYRVDFYNVAGTIILRTVNVTAQTASYSAANQVADGLTPGDPVNVRITQRAKFPQISTGFDIDGFSEILRI